MEHTPPVILLVDDDPSQIAYLKETINKHFQFTILESEDGLSAAQLLCEKPISLIITDLFMPRMNGLELVCFVKTLPSHPPIIMLSSNADTKEQEKAKQLGVSHFFKKSDDLSLLINVIKQMIAK